MESVSTDQLLKAQVILEGFVDSYTNTGQAVITDTDEQRGDRKINCNTYNISITVDKVINGSIQTNIIVGGLFAPIDIQRDGYILLRHQHPILKKRLLFFLSYIKEDNEYLPVSQNEFALEIEQYPKINGSAGEMLRAIAKANVEATNYTLAVRWARFLSGLHDDFLYWTNKTQDSRILIKAAAYETLVQDFPQTPGLRADVIKCLSDSNPPEEDTDVQIAHMQLISSISKLFDNEPPKVEEIQSLLASGDKNVNETALTLIRRKKDTSLMADVVRLMTTSKNRDVQYDCIKTLYVLTKNPHLIMYQTFLKQPDDYIKQWQAIVGNPAQN